MFALRSRVVLLALSAALGAGCASDAEAGAPQHGGAGFGAAGVGALPASGGGGAGTGAQGGATALSGAGGNVAAGAGATGGSATSVAGASGAGMAGSGALVADAGGNATGGQGAVAGTSAAGTAGIAAGSAGMAGMAALGDPKIVLVAGSGTGGDGSPATSAAVLNPYGAVVDPLTGDVYIAECDTGKIRHIDASGTITTVVGPGAPGAAGNIELSQPHDLLFQPGTRILFIADTMNGNVYRLNTETGEAALFVGMGTPFAKLSIIYCLAFSPSGTDLYYTGPDDIRVIDLEAMAAKPAVPYAAARVIAVDSKGTLYAVKNRPNGDALQVVDAAGKATDMPATVNVVSDPKHLTVDADDDVLIADTELFLLRKYQVKSDALVTLVGNGVSGKGMLDGDPSKAQLKRPHGVFFDKKTGVTYLSDSENDRVLKLVR
jgi:hypothetical protein